MPTFDTYEIDWRELNKRTEIYAEKLRAKGVFEGGSKWMDLMGRFRQKNKYR